jgi:hypothetical protein
MIITSPVKRFPGTVVLPDFMTLPQVQAWDEWRGKRDEIQARIQGEGLADKLKTRTELDSIYLPAFFMIVSEWHLENVPEHPTLETFPLTPRLETAKLIGWISAAIETLYFGEVEIPNA